jgi:solute carrier family 35 protein C2
MMYDVDAQGDDTDEDSAEEDPEEELLIASELYKAHRPWGWRDTLTAGGCILGWYSVGISAIITNKLLLRMRRFQFPFTLCLTYMFVKWPLARLCLFVMRRPPLAFRSWGPYLWTIALTGVLTAIDVGLGLCSYLYVSVVFIVIVRASSPCWQLLFGTLLGLETPSCSLLVVVLLVSGGVSLAALGEFEFNLLGFGLVLSSAALAGLRSCTPSGGKRRPLRLARSTPRQWADPLPWQLAAPRFGHPGMLQRLLHGRHTAELLAWRQSVHPVQLIYALAPWTTFTALVLALFMEGEELSDGLLQHAPHLRSLMLRLLGMSCLIFCMVIMEMWVVAKTSALTLSVAGTLKEVLTIACAEEVFHDHLSWVNMLGLLLCLIGANLYAFVKLASTGGAGGTCCSRRNGAAPQEHHVHAEREKYIEAGLWVGVRRPPYAGKPL